MDNYSITRSGEALSADKYRIDLENKTFRSSEGDLVLDFDLYGWYFKTGSHCTFKSGSSCTFDTGGQCTFNTGVNCTFDTDGQCTFNTGWNCTFDTGIGCIFKTGSGCTFNTYNNCTFALWKINTCKFNISNNSIILDRKDGKTYKITKEFIQLQKITNG